MLLGYFRNWTLVFAGLGYLLGLSFGFGPMKALWWMLPVGFFGLVMALLADMRRFHIKLQAIWVLWGIGGVSLANLALGLPKWGIALFMIPWLVIGFLLPFLLGLEPALEWQKALRKRERDRTGLRSGLPQ